MPADAALYREIRLAGLKCDPAAFGSTFETENAQALTSFAARLGSSAVFGAFDCADLLGIAGFVIRRGVKESHKGLLWGMYVRPHARKAGVGRKLVEAVIDFARGHVELLQLTVVSDNQRARRLYASLGFVEYGIEKNSLKQDGRYFDEILMAMDLVSDSARDPIRMPSVGAALCAEREIAASPSSGIAMAPSDAASAGRA